MHMESVGRLLTLTHRTLFLFRGCRMLKTNTPWQRDARGKPIRNECRKWEAVTDRYQVPACCTEWKDRQH